jgi:RsiW-degrading membrane proteinase PrsW (M82 family)
MEIADSVLPSVLAAVAPTLLYVAIVWWLDRYEKEPIWLASVAFLWGAVPAVIIAFVLEYALGTPVSGGGSLLGDLVEAGLAAPIVEECAKALALLGIYTFVRREFDDVLDGLVYGALIGFGFGMTENAFYFISNALGEEPINWHLLVVMRSVVFGLNHAFFTSLTGVSLGYARAISERWKRSLIVLAGLSAAIFFHVIHNTFATLAEYVCLSLGVSIISQIGGLLVLFVILLMAWSREKEWLKQQLLSEVEAGLISRDEYEVVGSYRRRVSTRWKALTGSGWRSFRRWGRLIRLSTELAFAKQRKSRKGEKGTEERIRRLREEIRSLGVDV